MTVVCAGVVLAVAVLGQPLHVGNDTWGAFCSSDSRVLPDNLKLIFDTPYYAGVYCRTSDEMTFYASGVVREIELHPRSKEVHYFCVSGPGG
jgi:hypothetical protein